MHLEELKMVEEWDKTFPKSEKVNHKKITEEWKVLSS